MTWVRLHAERIDGFPAGFTVLGTDELGDPLAVDAAGKVWRFGHDTSTPPWRERSLAFATVQLLQEHIAFQSHFAPPPLDADLDTLRAQKAAIERFVRGRKGAPFSRDAAKSALVTLREAIADRRHAASKRGRGLAECQALALRCEAALREAGARGDWVCRAAAPDGSVLGVMGDFVAPWTEARVTGLLAPLVGDRTLRCHRRPAPRSAR